MHDFFPSEDPHAVVLTVDDVEDKIRYAAQTRRARTVEYLKDFDRLRCGFITRELNVFLFH